MGGFTKKTLVAVVLALSAMFGACADKDRPAISSRSYFLSFVNNQGMRYGMPLIISGDISVARNDIANPSSASKLHFYEPTESDGQFDVGAAVGEYCVLSSQTNATNIVQILSLDPGGRAITFRDLAGTTSQVFYNDATGNADLTLGGATHSLVVKPGIGQIYVDLNADLKFDGKQSPITDQSGAVITREFLLGL